MTSFQRSEDLWRLPFNLDPLPVRHTSAEGWASLLASLPHGLFSLDVRNNALTHASYALLRENVAELRAGRVYSPQEEVASAGRRATAASKRAGVVSGGAGGSEGKSS